MAWCPKCEGNYQIVVSTNSSSTSVPVVSERYNRAGEYIGYEEGEAYVVNTVSLPRCSNCYCVFDFPNATSKKEYFYARRKFVIERWLAYNPKPPEPSEGIIGYMIGFIGIIGGLLVGVIAYFVNNSFFAAFIIGLLAAVGLWWFGFWLDEPRMSKKREEYKNKILKPWKEKLYALQSMEYSDENYERLKKIDPKPRK